MSSVQEKVDIHEGDSEVQITVDTTGTGRAIADSLIHHVNEIIGDDD